MSDARWIEIESAIASSVRHFRGALTIHGNAEPDAIDYSTEMAFLHAMQSGHTSLESALVRILGLFQEQVPAGAEWHADLIARAGKRVGERPPILSPELRKAADETRRFRHIAVRAYDAFEWYRASAAVASAALLSERLIDTVSAFRLETDP